MFFNIIVLIFAVLVFVAAVSVTVAIITLIVSRIRKNNGKQVEGASKAAASSASSILQNLYLNLK